MNVSLHGSVFCKDHRSVNSLSPEELKRMNRKKPGKPESDLQTWCIKWFRGEFPEYANLLFSIPNGGRTFMKVAKQLKAEGVRSGVSDLFLMKRRSVDGTPGLWIEMKSERGYLAPEQKQFQSDAVAEGYMIATCYSKDEFMNAIHYYIDPNRKPVFNSVL